jgi:GIY-YIG catalytic domain
MIGTIYKIIHAQSDICYVGSTLNKELKQRWKHHKEDYSKWLNGKPNGLSIYPSFKQPGIDQFKIILIKEYEVVDRTDKGV